MRNLHISISLFLSLFFLTTTFAQIETHSLAEANTTLVANKQKSATLSCQTDHKDASFVRQKDLAGQDIEAFDLSSLRSNARYGLVESYKEGFARIKKDQVFGFLNICGDEVVPCQYQDAEPFNEGRALVKKVNWYFVDAKGEESNALKNVTQAKALVKGISIAYFQNGQCALVDNKFDVSNAPISALYEEISAFCRQEIFKVKRNGKFGLINLAGKELMQTDFENIEECGLSNIFKVIKNGKVGLADTEWVVRVTPTFDKISDFDKNGLAIANEGSSIRLLSNRTFKASALYKTISGFDQNKLAKIQAPNGDFGLINTDLAVVLEPQYREIGDFNKFGLASACRFEQKCGFISLQGKEVIPPQYSAVGQFTHHGIVVVKDFQEDCNKGKGCTNEVIYDKNGQLILSRDIGVNEKLEKLRFNVLDSLHNQKFISVQLFEGEEIKGFHLIESSTFKLTTKAVYSAISPFDRENLSRVRRDGKWTLMDVDGVEVFEPVYTEIRRGNDGFYAVKNEKELFGFIDKKGKIMIPFEYDDVKIFKKGHCVVTKGREKWGLINKFNAKIIPLYFKTVSIKETHYEMTDDKGNTYIVNENGDCQGSNCTKFEELRKKANH